MTFLTEVQTAFSVGAYWLVGYSLDRGKMQSIRRSFVVVQNTSSATFAFALEMQCGQIHPRPSPNVVWVIWSQRAFDSQLNPFTSVLIAEFALQWPWGKGNLFCLGSHHSCKVQAWHKFCHVHTYMCWPVHMQNWVRSKMPILYW